MEMKGHPQQRRGERNIFCPLYNDCLNYAVQSGWIGWSCSRCPYKSVTECPHEYGYARTDSAFCYEMQFTVEKRSSISPKP
jgi:hypothetical protein